MPTDKIETIVSWVIIGAFAFAGIFGIYMLSSPNSEVITNITVIEKYSIGAIPGYKATTYVPSKIIDENGNLYTVSKEQLWAKLKINQTYEVRIITTNGNRQRKINAARIDGLWWQ